MVSQHEIDSLTEAFKREPVTSAAVVFKCVAGLLVVAGLVVIGAQIDTTGVTATAVNQSPSQGYEKTSIAQGRTLDQRQTRPQPTQAGVVSQLLSTNAADTGKPNHRSGLMQRGPAPVNPLQN